MCETLIYVSVASLRPEFNGNTFIQWEENIAPFVAFRLFTRASLLDHITIITKAELTLSVFHLILYGDITKTIS